MAPPWSVWWRFNVTSEALTMRKGQAWPKCCTPARWRCWVKRVCAANTSWSLQDPATPERMIHHLACSLMLKYRGENPDSARPVLVMPPLTCEALPEVCLCHSKRWHLPCSTPTCHQRMALLSCLLFSSDGPEVNTPGRAKKILWSLIRVSALCFANKLQMNYAYSLLSLSLSW